MNWRDVITPIAAFLGLGLSIFNAWQNWKRDRVHIKVAPIKVPVKSVVGADSLNQPITKLFLSPGIEVVNLSAFSITLEEVGYDLKGGESYRLSRLDSSGHWSQSGHYWVADTLPQRMEARSSLRLACADDDATNLKGKRSRRAYARTACGTTVYGRSAVLRATASRLAQGLDVMEPVS